ncbi:MarR family winged helix-turn-helix transcriptional regulator [Aliiroseovarius sp. YM-037]|uniref:MarR family winged helix-turn-helix transcriptional regulator n=1 Tax=Aliiroseovarius sp. YM-037 TaxID=3341728 RepID=UPI003A80AA5E
MNRTDSSLIALRRILRATELFGRELAKGSGLTPVQFRVLQVVAETGRSTPKDISVRMGVSQPTITSLIDKLVDRGAVRRQQSETDRRQTNILITELGQSMIDDSPDPLQQRYVRKFEALEDWEQVQLISSLERVAAMLDASDIDASPVLAVGDIKKTP